MNIHTDCVLKATLGWLRTVRHEAYLVGRKVCFIAQDSFSIDGIEKIAKAGGSIMEALSEFARFKGVFDSAIPGFKATKELCASTKALTVFSGYIKKDKEGHAHFCLPDSDKPFLECASKIFLDGAALLEAGVFLKKYGIFTFEALSKLANSIGQVKIFAFNRHIALNDIPVISGLLNRPKEMFAFAGFFLGSCHKLRQPIAKIFSLETAFKLIQNIGKMVLIAFGDTLKACGMKHWTIVIDVGVSITAIVEMVWKSHTKYQKVFFPAAPRV